MDDLRDLPDDDDYELSQDENDTLDELFPQKKTTKKSSKKSSGASGATKWKYLGEVTLLFIALLVLYVYRGQIPFTGSLFENKFTSLGIFGALFFILLFLLTRYLA